MKQTSTLFRTTLTDATTGDEIKVAIYGTGFTYGAGDAPEDGTINNITFTNETNGEKIRYKDFDTTDLSDLLGEGWAFDTGENLTDFIDGFGGADGYVLANGIYGNDVGSTLYGDSGSDSIAGGAGDDVIYGTGGTDFLFGGSFDSGDTTSASGDDTMYGGYGFDGLFGLTGDDVLYAGSGGGVIFSGSGSDSLFGGSGRDSLFSGTEIENGMSNFLKGKAGDDSFSLMSYASGVTTGGDTAYGGSGNDLFSSNDGDDVLFGGSGSDAFEIYDGINLIKGGADADSFDFSSTVAGSNTKIKDFDVTEDQLFYTYDGSFQDRFEGFIANSFQNNANVVFEYDGFKVVLKNVDINDITVDSFQLDLILI